jgi:heme/copper-type cytochrome/quinol oxidase subunit 2
LGSYPKLKKEAVMPSLQADFDALVQAGFKVMYDVTFAIVIIVVIALTVFLLDAGRNHHKEPKLKRR